MSKKTPRAEMDPEELERVRAMERRSLYRRQLYGGGFVPADKLQETIRHWVDDFGVTQKTIAERSGISLASVQQHYGGHNKDGPLTRCSKDTERAVTRLTFTEKDRERWGTAGIRRRLQALIYAGYSTKWLAAELGKAYQQVSAFILRGDLHSDFGHVDRAFGDRVIETYEKYIEVDPLTLGHGSHGVTYAKTVAKKRDYAPAHCWDSDTIDDPNAIPEWTGACGTTHGYDIHVRESIPLCDPCRAARGVDERISHVLENRDDEARTADCTGCGRQVDIILHGSSCSRGTRFRCGPHMRALQAARKARKKHQDAEIDRLDEEGKTAAEIAHILHVTTRTITRRRRERNGG